jgi:hypothetical protein
MKEREGVIISGTLCVLFLTWLGFLLHRSPQFAGSGLGTAFGIVGAVLMLVPLAYPIVKRIPFFHDRITAHVSLATLLTIHVYSGILGPIFAIIHTGHKFDSTLGIALTTTMLLVVVSGYAARYLSSYLTHDITDKLLILQTARGDLDSAWGVVEKSPANRRFAVRAPELTAGLASFGIEVPVGGPTGDVIRIAEGVADLEFSIRTHELFKRWFSRALKVHIYLSVLFYLLLALHIGSSIHFGLRWLR